MRPQQFAEEDDREFTHCIASDSASMRPQQFAEEDLSKNTS